MGQRLRLWTSRPRKAELSEATLGKYKHLLSLVGLRPPSLQGASPCIPRRRCHPAPGSKTESHALVGMASCFAGLVRVGAFWCQRYSAVRGWIRDYGAHEHQRASAAEAVQRIVEIVVVRLITSDGRRSCRRCDYVQRLQQIAKLNRGSCQLLLDDGANRLPQAFVCGCLAVIGIDRRNDQRAVGQAALCMKLTQQRSGLRAGWIARCRRGSGHSDPGC